jgi:hypothetical protein
VFELCMAGSTRLLSSELAVVSLVRLRVTAGCFCLKLRS